MNKLCPICIEEKPNVFIECNHGYCVSCLCRIKSCALCRKPLQRYKLCIDIKNKVKLINTDMFDISSQSLHPNDVSLGTNSFRLNFNHPVRELFPWYN